MLLCTHLTDHVEQSEKWLIDKIQDCFSEIKSISWQSDSWIEENPYIFETVNPDEAIFYLPAFMTYVLKTFRKNSGSIVYMKTLDAL